MEHHRYPNESDEYRAARNALLDEEIALRAQIEAVAAKRRALPPGGAVPEDYAFERIGADCMPQIVKMSELFGPHDTLILCSFMYGPERKLPCPGCTHLLDGIDGAARHIGRRAALHIVAKSPIARLAAWRRNAAGSISRCCRRRATARRGLFRRHVEVHARHAQAARRQGRRGLGRDDVQRLPPDGPNDRPLLGLRDGLRAAGAGPAPSRRGLGRSAVEPPDMTPEGRGDRFPKVEYG